MINLDFTNSGCIYAGRSRSGIPLLVSGNGFLRPACDYLRHRVIYEAIKPSTAKTYAEDLQVFFNFLEKNKIEWNNVTDRVLLAWRDWQDVSDTTKNRRLSTVIAMYVWLEEKGYVVDVVKVEGVNDQRKFTPQITTIKAATGGRGRRKTRGIRSILTIKSTRKPPPAYTPTDAELTNVFGAIANEDQGLAMRNNLLLSWYRQTGVRRMEWQTLTVDLIPGYEEIYDLYDKSECADILLNEGKGSKVRYVAITPELLEQTREYIDGPRKQLVSRFLRKSGYREPSDIFLSHKTGLVIELNSISNLINGLMKTAGLKSRGHRIRARFLTELVESEVASAEAAIAASWQAPDFLVT